MCRKSACIAVRSLEHRLLKEINYTKWKANAVTVAGGNGQGNQTNQLAYPEGVFIDKSKTIYIADRWNHRIVQWEHGSNIGQTIAGGHGQGNRSDQLDHPTHVIVEKPNHSFMIADYGNKRVMRWFFADRTRQQTLMSQIACWSLAIDKDGFVYVCEHEKNEVIRWKEGDQHRVVVAGGHGSGHLSNQLHFPTYIFVDGNSSVYVSDHRNHRVMKWIKDATEGIVVAGGLNQLTYPRGVTVDPFGRIYVVDCDNHRVMRWSKEATQGEIVVDGTAKQNQSDRLGHPTGLSFDDEGNLYVADWKNHRIQKYGLHID